MQRDRETEQQSDVGYFVAAAAAAEKVPSAEFHVSSKDRLLVTSRLVSVCDQRCGCRHCRRRRHVFMSDFPRVR